MGLETKFENFKIEDHESIEEMYNRLLSIQNEFSDFGEPLTNNKVVDKILRVML
jgi:gag-polypeptide of LTR copia-type